MTLSLEAAIARVPQWAGARDLKVTPLSGGITNSNYRIDVDGASFVLRLPGADTELLGIDREHEHAANLAAGKLGLGPEVVYFIRPEGYLVTRFLPGRPIPPEELRRPENLRRVAEAVRRIHALPPLPGRFDVVQVIRDYVATASRFGVALPDNYPWLAARLDETEAALHARPLQACPCHNDLLNLNFLLDEQLWILDWEYAGMGDPFFDLANFSDHHDLTEAQDRWLLECYFGQPAAPGRWAHLKIMKMLSDLREATWALVQIGISKLDFDFREYAEKFFGRVNNALQNPQWNDWLKEVHQNV